MGHNTRTEVDIVACFFGCLLVDGLNLAVLFVILMVDEIRHRIAGMGASYDRCRVIGEN